MQRIKSKEMSPTSWGDKSKRCYSKRQTGMGKPNNLSFTLMETGRDERICDLVTIADMSSGGQSDRARVDTAIRINVNDNHVYKAVSKHLALATFSQF